MYKTNLLTIQIQGSKAVRNPVEEKLSPPEKSQIVYSAETIQLTSQTVLLLRSLISVSIFRMNRNL